MLDLLGMLGLLFLESSRILVIGMAGMILAFYGSCFIIVKFYENFLPWFKEFRIKYY